MKTILKCLLSLVGVFGLGVSLSQAGQFEGEVDYHMTMSNGDQSDVAYFLKDGKARMQMNMKGHDVVDIMDLPSLPSSNHRTPRSLMGPGRTLARRTLSTSIHWV